MADFSHGMRVYMKAHLPLYIFVAVLFVTGVIFGAVMVSALTLEQKQDLSRNLGNFFQMMDQGSDMDAKHSFVQIMFINLKWLGLIWLFGLSVIGLPLILVLDFLKGVLVGFTIGFVVSSYAWKGMLFALVSVVPQNILIVPAIMICSVTAIAFALNLIKQHFLKQPTHSTISLLKYTTTAFSLAMILLVVSLYEAVLSPLLMKWVTPMLISII